MRILLLLLVPPLLIFGCALIVIWVPLPRPLPPALSSARNLMAAITTGILGIAYIIGLFVYLVSAVSTAGRVVDPVLVSHGLSSQRYMLFGRQAHGLVDGRQVDVQFMPSQGIRPALLQVYVAADVDARVAIGTQRPLLDCRDCARIEITRPELRHLEVYAQDAAWTRMWLDRPANSAALGRLLGDPQGLGLREFYVQPDRIWLRAHPSARVTALQVRQWFDDLLALAAGVEGIGGD